MNINIIRFSLLSIILLIVKNDDQIPDLCTHWARFDTLTQYIKLIGNKRQVMYFVTRNGFYWILRAKEDPTTANTRGRLPHGFLRGDASYFREEESCDAEQAVPQLVIVENFQNQPSFEMSHKYMIFDINSESFSTPRLISEDIVLKELIKDKESTQIDAIINLSVLKVGPYAQRFDDEFLFVFTTRTVNSVVGYYYSHVSYKGCNGRGHTRYYNYIPVERTLWPMYKPIDAVFLYTEYPDADPKTKPTWCDIIVFQENAHYMLNISLETVYRDTILNYTGNNVITQYYSTFFDCAPGGTPEKPIYPNQQPTPPSVNGSVDPGNVNQTSDDLITAKSPSPGRGSKTFKYSLISTLLVLFTVSILLTITLILVMMSEN